MTFPSTSANRASSAKGCGNGSNANILACGNSGLNQLMVCPLFAPTSNIVLSAPLRPRWPAQASHNSVGPGFGGYRPISIPSRLEKAFTFLEIPFLILVAAFVNLRSVPIPWQRHYPYASLSTSVNHARSS